MKILLSFFITMFLIFAVSFLLDLEFIQNNWLRYLVIVFVAFGLLFLGFVVIMELVIDLKKKNKAQSSETI